MTSANETREPEPYQVICLERLIVTIRRSAKLVFAGLVLVSLALLFSALKDGPALVSAQDALVNRDLHYMVMIGIVAVYLYVQRVAP